MIDKLATMLHGISNNKGYSVSSVFTDFLDYTLGFFNPTGKPIIGWSEKYSREDSSHFFDILQTYLFTMQEEIKNKYWYDAFGDLFMAIHPKGQRRGQFFTPPSLCDMMAELSLEDYNGANEHKTRFGQRIIINDCSAGSGRCLLAAHAIFVKNKNRKPYLVAEDLDVTCCKMTAINMAVHGCFGEVICHDTLAEPKKVRQGWIINETMYPFPTPIPSIRPCDEEQMFYTTRHRKSNVVTKEENACKQLQLF